MRKSPTFVDPTAAAPPPPTATTLNRSSSESNSSGGSLSSGSLSPLISNQHSARPTMDHQQTDNLVLIPDYSSSKFSLRKLWMFMGPGFLMSIAFLDPGNIENDLRTGAIANYKLLWVLMTSTIMGLLMQRLSARLGVVSGHHLAELCFHHYKTVPRLLLWIMIEVAIIGSDMQEVIGTAIALNLLSSKRIPLWIGVLITIIDTFTFLFLDKYGLRKLEFFFGLLITVMAVSFGYEYVQMQPVKWEIVKGLVIPWCSDCGTAELLQAIGIVGSVLMPHNFYLHSALVRTRKIDRVNDEKITEANRYYFIETCLALFVSFLINVSVVAVFAHGMFHMTNNHIRDTCQLSPNVINASEVFPANDRFIDADIYKSGVFLGCSFGYWAMLVWSIGILAAGQSSTMTGTYAGQFVMEGFLDLRWARWKRVLFTRIIAILPTFWLAFYSSRESLTDLNDILNALMSLQLPFAIIPTIAFTSSDMIMGSFKNGRSNIIIAILLTGTVIVINSCFVVSRLGDFTGSIFDYIIIAIYICFYVVFVAYLLVHMAVLMGQRRLQQIEWIRTYVMCTQQYQLGIDEQSIVTKTTPMIDSDRGPNDSVGGPVLPQSLIEAELKTVDEHID